MRRRAISGRPCCAGPLEEVVLLTHRSSPGGAADRPDAVAVVRTYSNVDGDDDDDEEGRCKSTL